MESKTYSEPTTVDNGIGYCLGGVVTILGKIFGDTTAQYDLSVLELPRIGLSWDENRDKQRQEWGHQNGVGSVMFYVDMQDVALRLAPASPFLTTIDGRAQAILRLDNLLPHEIEPMLSAVKAGQVLVIPVLAKCPTCVVVGFRFCIFDDPKRPFIAEAVRDLQVADVQDFATALLKDGGGAFHLYAGIEAESAAKGTFLLRMPPFNGAGLPYTTSKKDLKNFWYLLEDAARHLNKISAAKRDFTTASHLYMENTKL